MAGTGNPQTDADLADMTLALARNPETRKGFAALAKKAKLPVNFQDVDSEESTLAATKEIVDERLEAAARARAAADTTARLNAQRSKLIKSDANPDGRFTEEVVKEKLEPFMQERGISDYEDAAILFGVHNPQEAPKPEIATRGIWEMPAGDVLKDPRAWARREANKAVGDIIARR